MRDSSNPRSKKDLYENQVRAVLYHCRGGSAQLILQPRLLGLLEPGAGRCIIEQLRIKHQAEDSTHLRHRRERTRLISLRFHDAFFIICLFHAFKLVFFPSSLKKIYIQQQTNGETFLMRISLEKRERVSWAEQEASCKWVDTCRRPLCTERPHTNVKHYNHV